MDKYAPKTKRIRLTWAGGVHWFELETRRIPEFNQNVTEVSQALKTLREGPQSHTPATLHDREMDVLRRLVTAKWGSEDIIETIRCGLIGGGDLKRDRAADEWAAAAALVTLYVQPLPLAQSVPLAQTILAAACYGVDEALAAQGMEPANIPQSAFVEDDDTDG